MDSGFALRAPRNDTGERSAGLINHGPSPRPAAMTFLSRISVDNDERAARLAGIGLMLLSISMFSFGDALGKFLVGTYAVGQLLWLRACAALLLLSPVIWQQRAQFRNLERPWLQLI